jgi:hypothetical protein
MSIAVQNEMQSDGDLLSPFMRPVLYFSVSGAAAVTNPIAEIVFDGTTEDVTIEAVFLRTASSLHYFSVDLSDVMKYLMRSFDGSEYPDDIEFINGNLVQSFDEYFRDIAIDIYFERGTANEQTLKINHYWLYLAEQMPAENGFNLYRVYVNSCLQNLKWSKNTYNALFFWAGGATTITRGTVGGSGGYTADSTTVTADDTVTVDSTLTGTGATVIYSGTLTPGYYQLKFAKTSVYLDKGANTITITTPAGSKSIIIYFDPDCPNYIPVLWQHPLLGYVSFPFTGSRQDDVSAKKLGEIGKVLTTMVNVNTLKEITGYEATKKVSLTTKADAQFWPLLEALYHSRHVYLFVGADGAEDSSATWVECEVSGGCSFKSDRARATFNVELTLPETFNVRF